MVLSSKKEIFISDLVYLFVQNLLSRFFPAKMCLTACPPPAAGPHLQGLVLLRLLPANVTWGCGSLCREGWQGQVLHNAHHKHIILNTENCNKGTKDDS